MVTVRKPTYVGKRPLLYPIAAKIFGGLAVITILLVFLVESFVKDHVDTTSSQVQSNYDPTAVHKLVDFRGEAVRLRHSLMPANGYGTCCRKSAKGSAIYHSTLAYLRAGGRLIDTAMAYDNHHEIGRAVRDSGVHRDRIWITSKISPNRIKRGDVTADTLRAVDNIIDEIDAGYYLDLCLIHTPKLGKSFTLDAWKALIQARNEGKIKSIGVSNFNKNEILDLQRITGEFPEVNQIQYHPWTSSEWKDLVQWQRENGIVTTAYNSLGGSKFQGSSPQWPDAVVEAARKHEVTEAQLLLRWALRQENVAVIPGATSDAHIKENLNTPKFELDPKELEEIEAPPRWFDVHRGPSKYRANEALGRAWTGDHTIPKQ